MALIGMAQLQGQFWQRGFRLPQHFAGGFDAKLPGLSRDIHGFVELLDAGGRRADG